MSGNPNFGTPATPRPLGTFFRWEIPSEGISVHLNLRIIELMERDAIQAGTKAVAGVLLGRPHRGRDFIIAIEHYEMSMIEGEVSDSPFMDLKLAESIRERWRPGRSRMSILGLYRTTVGDPVLNTDDTSALAKILETADPNTNSKKAGQEYAPRVTPVVEDPNQVFLMIGPRTERISKATLYLVRKGVVICESPQIPFDRTELSKLGSASAPREPRPSATPEPSFSTQDVPSPTEPKRENRKRREPAVQQSQAGPSVHAGQDLAIPNWIWPAITVPMLGILIAGYYWNHRKQPSFAVATTSASATATTSVLGLKLDRSGPAWKLSWNENAAVVQGAARGRLLITDGGVHRTLDLGESDLHGGTIIYSPVTNDVVLELQVDSPDSSGPVSETVRVVGGVLPPLASPEPADALSLPVGNSDGSVPAPPALVPPAVQQPYPGYPRNSTQVARNFPPAETKAAPVPQVSPYAALRGQPTPSPLPPVAAEMPEAYRSLMTKPNPAAAQPVLGPKPVPAATQMPTAYRSLLAPARPDSRPTKAYKHSPSLRASSPLSPAPTPSLPLHSEHASKTTHSLSRSAVAPKVYAPALQSVPSPATKPENPGDDVQDAQLLSREDPEYPATAKDSGIAGTVEVHFRIGADGKVYDVTVVKGLPLLSQAAVEAVQKWRYKPARIDGVPSDSDASATFSFKQN